MYFLFAYWSALETQFADLCPEMFTWCIYGAKCPLRAFENYFKNHALCNFFSFFLSSFYILYINVKYIHSLNALPVKKYQNIQIHGTQEKLSTVMCRCYIWPVLFLLKYLFLCTYLWRMQISRSVCGRIWKLKMQKTRCPNIKVIWNVCSSVVCCVCRLRCAVCSQWCDCSCLSCADIALSVICMFVFL